jgi:hypothetical protein
VSANGFAKVFYFDSSASIPSSFSSGPGKFAPAPLVAPAPLGGCSQILSAAVLTHVPGHRSVSKPAASPVNSDLVPGAPALGNRLPVMTESGAPMVRSVYKQTLKYYRRAREARGKPAKGSLLLEALDILNAPPVQFQSLPF